MIFVDEGILIELVEYSEDVGEDLSYPEYTWMNTVSTTEYVPGTDDFAVWKRIVFKYNDLYYMTWYCYPTEYWRRNSGERWDSYFLSLASHWKADEKYTLQKDGTVRCTPVKRVEVITYKYEVIPE